MEKIMADYEPKIVAFCCTYCAYSAADLAGSMRLQYPSNVRIIKLLCTGKVEPNFFALLVISSTEDTKVVAIEALILNISSLSGSIPTCSKSLFVYLTHLLALRFPSRK